jgi:hypothetical protein
MKELQAMHIQSTGIVVTPSRLYLLASAAASSNFMALRACMPHYPGTGSILSSLLFVDLFFAVVVIFMLFCLTVVCAVQVRAAPRSASEGPGVQQAAPPVGCLCRSYAQPMTPTRPACAP